MIQFHQVIFQKSREIDFTKKLLPREIMSIIGFFSGSACHDDINFTKFKKKFREILEKIKSNKTYIPADDLWLQFQPSYY